MPLRPAVITDIERADMTVTARLGQLGDAGIRLLTEVVPVRNILFGSEMIGAVRGVDPETGHHYEDARRYVDAAPGLGAADRAAIYAGNALRVYPRLAASVAVSERTAPGAAR